MNKKQGINLLITVLFLLPLSSCFVAKDYQRPAEVSTANLYRTDELVDSARLGLDSTTMADVSWQNLFSDSLLKQYIQTALDNNLDIRIALQNIDAAESMVKQGKASYGPMVNASLDYGHNYLSKANSSVPLPTRNVNSYNLGFDFSWEADIWGKIRSQERAYVATYLQSIEAHKAVTTRLVAQVASTYYQLAALSEQEQIARESIVSRDSSLTVIQALKDAGQQTAVAVKQAEAQLYDAKLLLVNLKNQERVLENVFCVLLNEPPHPVLRHSLASQSINTDLRIGVPAQLLANRPDVRASEFGLMNAFEMTNVARTNFYPSLMISGGAGFQSIDIKKWFSGAGFFANIAGDLLQPIFNRRQIRTQYEVAQSVQEQALLNYEKAILQAGSDVSNALYDYQTQTEAIALNEKQYQSLRTAVNYSEQLLINGLGTYLEVLTARQNALSSQLNLVNSRYLRLNSIVNLYQSLGGGWE